MSSPVPFFRRRAMGRASSPPTWACYEQIPSDDEDHSDSCDDDDSCSEDGEDYGEAARAKDLQQKDSHHGEDLQNMQIDEESNNDKVVLKDKGKQRAIDPELQSSKKRQQRERKERVVTLRPILTIHKSHGFVWNQDLFVPPYIKDRYIASTSPSSTGFISSSASSANSALADFEIEVVEIRIREDELSDIIP